MSGEELNFENIISGEEVEDLFTDTDSEDTGQEEDGSSEEEKNKDTTEVNADTLFGNTPESVSSEDEEEDGQEQEDTQSDDKDSGTSPKTSFYSSIATALRDEGILPDLDDEVLKNINTPEDFAEAMEKLLQNRLDERQRRIDEALQSGVEPEAVKKYENIISYLDNLTEDTLKDESEEGENLRRNLIYQDFINRGFSEARAKRETDKSFTAGTDLEDATEALGSNKEFYQNNYKSEIDKLKEADKAEKAAIKKQAEELQKSILSEEAVFGEVTLDKATRQKVLDNLTKPVYRTEDGRQLTALQKAEMDNRTDFLKKLGVVFTLTNGFKDLDGLVKGKVKKETRKSLKELEHVLSNTSRNTNGNLSFLSGAGGVKDSESKVGLKLDV